MYNLEKILQFEEGKKLTAYIDTEGYLTVGIGHNLDSDKALSILGRELKKGSKITEEECAKLFSYDLQNVMIKIARNIPYFESLKEKYKILLINMFFQLKNPLSFENTLKAIKEDRPNDVVKGIQRSLWYKQTPNRCARLIKLVKDEQVKEWL